MSNQCDSYCRQLGSWPETGFEDARTRAEIQQHHISPIGTSQARSMVTRRLTEAEVSGALVHLEFEPVFDKASLKRVNKGWLLVGYHPWAEQDLCRPR